MSVRGTLATGEGRRVMSQYLTQNGLIKHVDFRLSKQTYLLGDTLRSVDTFL